VIESYESSTAEPTADHALDRIEARLQAIEGRWAEVEAQLHRLHPEADADSRRGRLVTPPRVARH
jgi:hypothetical protein